mmetsp:Transcript_97909/g.192289  ORF Transcript_97909/g.192289 Transcript_97909/m.192289 type:complete len:244 (-) Transcript_97909:463-1194(-)
MGPSSCCMSLSVPCRGTPCRSTHTFPWPRRHPRSSGSRMPRHDSPGSKCRCRRTWHTSNTPGCPGTSHRVDKRRSSAGPEGRNCTDRHNTTFAGTNLRRSRRCTTGGSFAPKPHTCRQGPLGRSPFWNRSLPGCCPRGSRNRCKGTSGCRCLRRRWSGRAAKAGRRFEGMSRTNNREACSGTTRLVSTTSASVVWQGRNHRDPRSTTAWCTKRVSLRLPCTLARCPCPKTRTRPPSRPDTIRR